MKKHLIGKGEKMSVAKAAILVYYEQYPKGKEDNGSFIYSGDLDIIHRIIDKAGARHAGPATKDQVIGRLFRSPFWITDGTTKGWMGRRANCYVPSKKGEEFYKMYKIKEKLTK